MCPSSKYQESSGKDQAHSSAIFTTATLRSRRSRDRYSSIVPNTRVLAMQNWVSRDRTNKTGLFVIGENTVHSTAFPPQNPFAAFCLVSWEQAPLCCLKTPFILFYGNLDSEDRFANIFTFLEFPELLHWHIFEADSRICEFFNARPVPKPAYACAFCQPRYNLTPSVPRQEQSCTTGTPISQKVYCPTLHVKERFEVQDLVGNVFGLQEFVRINRIPTLQTSGMRQTWARASCKSCSLKCRNIHGCRPATNAAPGAAPGIIHVADCLQKSKPVLCVRNGGTHCSETRSNLTAKPGED
eukprot:2877206-Rhodomonas_salina.5